MAHDDSKPADPTTDGAPDRAADTASFRRFVDAEPDATTGSDGRTFRLLTLLAGAVVLVVIVLLLLV